MIKTLDVHGQSHDTNSQSTFEFIPYTYHIFLLGYKRHPSLSVGAKMAANNQLEVQRKTIAVDTIGSFRSILCDQTLSTPKLELKHSSNPKEITHQQHKSLTTIKLSSDTGYIHIMYNRASYTVKDIGDVICFGVTLVIILILLSMLSYCYVYIDDKWKK